MAKETTLELFQSTDHIFRYEILTGAETEAENTAGWDISWMVKKSKASADVDAKITKTITDDIALSGVFNVDPALNTLRLYVTIRKVDSDDLPAGIYYHELKRTNQDAEAVLSYGRFILRASVHRV